MTKGYEDASRQYSGLSNLDRVFGGVPMARRATKCDEDRRGRADAPVHAQVRQVPICTADVVSGARLRVRGPAPPTASSTERLRSGAGETRHASVWSNRDPAGTV